MYLPFNKQNIIKLLPERRSGMIFSNPDLFIVFGPQQRFVIWQEVLKKLDNKWLDEADLWMTKFDFGSDPDDYDKQFNDYLTVELLQFPILDESKISTVNKQHAFVFDLKKDLYINKYFIDDLKSAGAIDIWYDTTAPFGRY